MNLKKWLMILNVLRFCLLLAWRFYGFLTEISTGNFTAYARKLTLPFKNGCNALSVTCGDSSPKGRAKCASIRNGTYLYGYASLTVLRCPQMPDWGQSTPGRVGIVRSTGGFFFSKYGRKALPAVARRGGKWYNNTVRRVDAVHRIECFMSTCFLKRKMPCQSMPKPCAPSWLC